jgi:LysM domain
MAVTWLECEPAPGWSGSRPGGLRLVGGTGAAQPDDDRLDFAGDGPSVVVSLPRRVPPEVRRRRTLLVVMGVLLGVLALPLSGTGGHSHPIGSALPVAGPITYVVQPGDSLWSIAERVDPSGDPRPLMARLALQTGSDTVVPGERVVLP